MRTLIVCLVIGVVCCLLGANAEKHHSNSKSKSNKKHKPNELMKAKTTLEPLVLKRVETINQFGDILLREVPLIMDKYGMNPFLAPNLEQYIAPVNLELSNIKVYNITNINRTSDILIMDDQINRKMSVAVKLQLHDVKLVSDYYANVKVGFISLPGFRGTLTAIIPEINADVKVLIDFKEVNGTLETLNLSMDKKRMDVKLSGSPEGNVLNIAMPAIVTILQGVILNIVGDPLKKQINEIIYQIVNMINGYLLSMSNGNQ